MYTKVLAERIVESFKRNNVILSSHLVAYAMFTLLEEDNAEKTLFELIKVPPKSITISLDRMVTQVENILANLKALENKVTLSEEFDNISTLDLILVGVGKVGVYHQKKVIKLKSKDTLGTEDLKLLYYYHNKVIHYNLPVNKKITEMDKSIGR